MWLLLFVAITLCLVIWPLLPSFIELSLATDVKPLKVVQEYDSNIKHFAIGFKTYLEKNFATFFDQNSAFGSGIKEGALRDGTGFQIIGDGGQLVFNTKETSKHTTPRMIISEGALALPQGMNFETEVYSKNTVLTGENSQFRAILAEKDIVLNPGCVVTRWIHSNASLQASHGCQLYGRCSAEENIYLASGTRFERLHAMKIMMGDTPPATTLAPVSAPRKILQELSSVKNQFERRWLLDGNIVVPANSDFDGDIVTTGSLTLEENVRIRGSVKSNGELVMARGCEVDGSLISTTHIHMGEQCRANGPVIAEVSIQMEEGCVIGSEATPATVNAPLIHVIGSALVLGTVWAAEEGLVIASTKTNTGPRV